MPRSRRPETDLNQSESDQTHIAGAKRDVFPERHPPRRFLLNMASRGAQRTRSETIQDGLIARLRPGSGARQKPANKQIRNKQEELA
jgi:hypothetical protein